MNTNKIVEKLKEQIMEEIFTEFPTISLLNDDSAFDVYVNSDDLADEYIICEKYEHNSVDDIRELMDIMLDGKRQDIEEILEICTQTIQINRFDEMTDEDFNYLKNREDSALFRAGTADEYVTFRTINLGGL